LSPPAPRPSRRVELPDDVRPRVGSFPG
jgi:hypothetical protein